VGWGGRLKWKLSLLAAATSAVLLYWGVLCFYASWTLLDAPLELEDRWILYARRRLPPELAEGISSAKSLDEAASKLNAAMLLYSMLSLFPLVSAYVFDEKRHVRVRL